MHSILSCTYFYNAGKLLQSAKHVDSHTNYRLYIKTGGYKKALSDFEKLNPTALRIYPVSYKPQHKTGMNEWTNSLQCNMPFYFSCMRTMRG